MESGRDAISTPTDLLAGHETRGVRRRVGAGVTSITTIGDPHEVAVFTGDAAEVSAAPGGGGGFIQELNSGSRHSARHRIATRCGRGLDVAATGVFLLQPTLVVLLSGMEILGGLLGGLTKAATVLVLSPPASALVITGVMLLVYRILIFRRWRDEHAQVPRFIICFLVMVLELSIENCVVWLVSAWDQRKYDNIPGLQDNVAIGVNALSAISPMARWLVTRRAANILHFLGAQLALAFSVLWDQVPYSGFGIMARVVLTVAASRVLRMACFMATVLPNPRPGCYRRRFPPVPPGLWDTIKLGYTTIRGFGGCNDLIFSGHGAFWVLAPLAFRTYYPGHRLSTWVLWLALVHACVKDVVDEQHYSVDMLLAIVVTWAVWDWLAWVYPAGESVLLRRPVGSPPDRLNPGVVGLILVCLAIAGVIVIGGKA